MIEIAFVVTNEELGCMQFQTREDADACIDALIERSPEDWFYDPVTNTWRCDGDRVIIISDHPTTPEELEKLRQCKLSKLAKLKERTEKSIDKEQVKLGRIVTRLAKLEQG